MYRVVQLSLTAVMILGSFGQIAGMLRDCWNPAELDYGEGIVLWQAKHILDPALTYRNIDTPPYNVTHYPPVYHLATRAMQTVTHNWVAAGRLVSVLSGIGIALVIGLLVWAALPRRVPWADRWAAAIFGGCSIFLHPFTTFWIRTARVDALGLFLSFAALAIYLSGRERFVFQLAAVGIFALAGFTKQSLFTIPAACLLIEMVVNWRRMLVLIGSGAVMIGVPLISLEQRTRGGFLLNLVFYNANPMNLAAAKSFLSGLFYSPWLLFALASPATLGTGLYLWRKRRCSIHWWSARCKDSVLLRTLLVLTVHLALSLVLIPVAGAKRGASSNYFLPMLLSLSPLAGITLWRAFAASRNFRRCDAAVLCSCSLIILACQPMVSAIPRVFSPAYEGDREEHARERGAPPGG